MMNDEVKMNDELKAGCGMQIAHGQRTRTTDLNHSSFIIHHSSFVRAFSLVEILVTIALLSFIVLGLFAMFNQTQRAFMSSMGQTDVLEGARTVTDMMTRDLEQLTPSGSGAINFLVRVAQDAGGADLKPLTQYLPGANQPLPSRTNYLEDVFILTRQNQAWVGIGYCVRVADPTGALYPPQLGAGQAGVGSLYRFSKSIPVIAPSGGMTYGTYGSALAGMPTDPSWLYQDFKTSSRSGSTNIANRICDGVVHLQVRSFATNGYPLYAVNATTVPVFRTNSVLNTYSPFRQAYAQYSSPSTVLVPDNMDLLYSWGNSVPAYLELELGIMEPRTFSRFDSIPAAPARLAYLQRDDISTRVHIFHQRIPVRTVDPSAFQ
jgi:hypothetical protein